MLSSNCVSFVVIHDFPAFFVLALFGSVWGILLYVVEDA